ncbi:helix-turn-helix transcriptional regulator [Spirillospora sp. NPDC047279]|uniref:helix-turn-helix domain-containing protein n=1 Tax=Spirillospora sp. NPDC047279 TaxID=3155478 RepID=UPI0033E04372
MRHVPQTNRPDPNTSLWAWLAHDLRFYREKHGLSQEALGEIINRTPASVSNCEAGRRHINDDEAKILDDLWQTGGHFQRLLLFARRSHNPDWFREHVSYEGRAKGIRTFQGLWVPGILQTQDYATASFRAAGVPNVEDLVEERLLRQEIMRRKAPPLLDILLDQAVLLRHVGGPAVMAAQLRHLAEASELPNVLVRVIPFSEGAHMGQDGGFKILTGDFGEVSYVEAPHGGRLMSDTSEVRSSTERWARIGAKALPEGPSKALLLSTMESMK